MASTYSPLLRYELIGAGEQAGIWGNTTNVNLGSLVEQSIAGVTNINASALGGTTYVLEALNGAPDEARSMVLNFTGSASDAFTVVVPTSQKLYVVRNTTTKTINFKTAAQVTPLSVEDANSTLIFCDGSNVRAGIAAPAVGTLLVSGGGTGATSFTAGFIRSPGGTGALTSAASVNLGNTDVTGTLTVNKGGTGFASYSTGQMLYASGSTTLTALNPGTSGQVLTMAGGIPTWATPVTGTVTAVTALSPLLSSGGTAPQISMSNSGVSAGTYTAASISVDTFGRVTGASSTTNLVTTNTSQNISAVKNYLDIQRFGTTDTSVSYSNTALYAVAPGSLTVAGTFYQGASTLGTGLFINNTNGTCVGFGRGSSAISYTLVGNISVTTTSTTYNTSSDRRLKESIEPLNNGIDLLKKLKPVTYNWIETGEADDGFIAQDLQEVPEFARRVTVIGKNEQGEEMYGVDYMRFSAVLAAALQEAVGRIESLESEIARMKS